MKPSCCYGNINKRERKHASRRRMSASGQILYGENRVSEADESRADLSKDKRQILYGKGMFQ